MITIVGQNLDSANYVDLDGNHVVPASSSSTQLTVTSPDHAAGVVHLRVTTPGGTSPSTAADNYVYLNPPVVTAVSPNLGSISGGVAVTIVGTGLSGTTAVLFGETSVAPAQVTSGFVVAYSPVHAAGIVHVRVRNNGGTSSITAADQFTYVTAGPVVTGISPNTGPGSGGTFVSIRGTGFLGAKTVSFGSVTAVPFSVTDTLLAVITPSHAPGLVHLRVTTTLGISPDTAQDDYTFTSGPPVVRQVSPRNGPVQGGTVITLTGTGFSGATTVRFGDQLVVPTSVTENQLTVVAPPHAAGVVHLLVTTPAGTSVEAVLDDYTYGAIAPQVLSVSPKFGPSSGGTVVTINGSGFSTAVGVAFGDQVITPSFLSATQIVVTAPSHAAGLVHLRVITPTGTSPETSADDYTYGGLPTVLSLSPTSGSTEGGTEIIISGSGFTGAQSVSFGDVSVVPYFVSENQLRVIAPRVSTSGVVHLRVTGPAGISSETPSTSR